METPDGNRVGAVCAISGAALLFIGTYLHPMGADPNDSEFIAHLSERLEELYSQSALTTREVDALGWFCNVLANPLIRSTEHNLRWSLKKQVTNGFANTPRRT